MDFFFYISISKNISTLRFLEFSFIFHLFGFFSVPRDFAQLAPAELVLIS